MAMGSHGWPWVAMGGHGPHGRWVTLNGHGRPWPAIQPWPAIRPWPAMAAFLKKKKGAMRPRTVNFFKSGHVAGWPDGRWVTPILVTMPPPTLILGGFCFTENVFRQPRLYATIFRLPSRSARLSSSLVVC